VVERINAQSDVSRVLILVFTGLVLALFMAFNAGLLYRVLEGYRWPKRLAERRTARWLRKWTALHTERDEIRKRVSELKELLASPLDPNERETHGAEIGVRSNRLGIVDEQLLQYPESAERFLPTRFGNALKAFEMFGFERYNLDSQT